MQIAIITCSTHPELSPSNALYRQALIKRGADVSCVPWNRTSSEEMTAFDLCVFRQSWDYQDDPAGFAAWVSNCRRVGTRFANDPDIILWNNDKRTLTALSKLGVEVPWMRGILQASELDIQGLPARMVIKPAFGGSGIGVRLCGKDELLDTLQDALAEAPGRPFIIQDYLPEITEGEWSLTFVDGQITHGVRKRPASGEFRVNGRFKPLIERVDPPASMRAATDAILNHLGPDILYGRLDGVMRGDRFICTELELTDPDLHFEWCEPAADQLAEATLDRARPR